jgi:REP element-mobilizing transposase RayT
MPNHYHLLLTLLENHRIHQVIQRVNSLSARCVNGVEGRQGRLWARRFYDHVVRNQDDFDECLRYIHDNPRVAGFVAASSQYAYSSADYWENGSSTWGAFDPP